MRLPLLLTSMVVALGVVPPGPAEAAATSAPCNNATLTGSYIFFVNGTTGKRSDSDHVAYAAMIVYDGKGNAKFSAVYADGTETTLAGTYSIDSHCKGEVVYENGRTAVYFIAPSGNELVYVVTAGTDVTAGAVVASSARRVSKELLLD